MNEHVHPTIMAAVASHIEAMRRARYVSDLLRADWHHEWSDDQRVVQAGRQELARLRQERAEIDPDCELWNRHAPNGFRAAP